MYILYIFNFFIKIPAILEIICKSKFNKFSDNGLHTVSNKSIKN